MANYCTKYHVQSTKLGGFRMSDLGFVFPQIFADSKRGLTLIWD